MSATAAVESVKADHVLVARSYGATRMQILTRVYVPSMMPILLETLRISMIFNFTGVMIAEMYASRTGIGHLIANWGENFQMPQLFAGVILLAAVAIAFNETVRFLEARMQRMANVANLSIVRSDRPTPRSRSTGLSHVYAGREGAVPALSDISMTVGAGRFVVIVGPSGCGKTSLLMMMAGLRHQTSGTIHVQGRPIAAPDPGPRRRRVPGGEPVPLALGARQHRVSARAARRAARGAPRARRPTCSISSACRASARAIRTSSPAA